MKNFNRSAIMKFAWKEFKSQDIKTKLMFSVCLKLAWQVARVQPDISLIYKKHYKLIYNFIMMKIHKIDICEELTNDVFIKASQYLFIAEKSAISTWLCQIAKTLLLDYFRKEKLDKHSNISSFSSDDDNSYEFQFPDKCKTDSLVNGNELKRNIQKAMSKLSDKNRRIAELYFIDEESYNEISEMLEMPLGSVKGMINRIRILLQAELKGDYQNI